MADDYQVDPEVENRITDAVEALLDVAVERFTEPREDGETFTRCNVCGGWEEHKDVCFVPAVERWLNEPGEGKR